MGLKTGGRDLDLQGQIGLETCEIPCECNNFCTIINLTFKLELCIDHLKVLQYFKNS